MFSLLPQKTQARVFGDGSHPTTLLCARAVDYLCRSSQVHSFLDVGTGTGILARTARARGATFIAATDIAPEALECARENAGLDGASTEIIVSDAAPDTWGARFELVAANILEGVLLELAPALSRALTSGGQLLLSGFTRPQTPRIELAYQEQGLELLSRSSDGEWVLLHFRRKRSGPKK